MQDALIALLKADPSLGTKALTTVISGQALPGNNDAALSAESLTLVLDAVRALEVSEYLGAVQAPTLVIHGRDDAGIPAELGRVVAAGIPNARLYEYDGPHTPPNKQVVDDVTVVISEFLAVDAPLDVTPPGGGRMITRTVLFTDLVGHTEMMSRLGDYRGRAVLREHERITREVLKAHGGTEVKTMGDGFMASFGSVTRAVECAVALQRAIEERNRDVGASHPRGGRASGPSDDDSDRNVEPATADDSPLRVRIGLNAGEPIEEEGDLFGATVILASRIAARADGGEILVADTVRGLCSGKGFLFADRGEFVAKGFEEPVRVYEVRWRE
jgi:class 3 adenylate cyclase